MFAFVPCLVWIGGHSNEAICNGCRWSFISELNERTSMPGPNHPHIIYILSDEHFGGAMSHMGD
ncbi:MAG: hypothetical protein QF473_32165, partial [Planctomycetota bacterium]|nr:hypothetical protein [Planctomycetota bacterium]